jgi:predicted TIM-barrel fold metal-dependent hydrolase
MRTKYTITDKQLEELLAASKPTPVMYISGGVNIGGDPQENANRAWRKLGDELGFDFMTVRPVAGEKMNVFTAESKQGE